MKDKLHQLLVQINKNFVGKIYEIEINEEDHSISWVWKNRTVPVKNGDEIKIIDYDIFKRIFLCKLNKKEHINVTFEFVENMIDKGLLRLKCNINNLKERIEILEQKE